MDRRTYLGIVAGGLVGRGGCTQWAGDTGETETGDWTGRTDIPEGDWPMFQVDAANTGYHPTASGPTNSVTERWRFEELALVNRQWALASSPRSVRPWAERQHTSGAVLTLLACTPVRSPGRPAP